MLYLGLKINVLIQLLCQISKRLYGESTPCDYVRTNLTDIFQPRRGVTKVRNSIKIKHLHLMIFIWWHSQDSMLHSKCLFCSIKLIFIHLFVCVFSSVIHMHKAWAQHPDEKSKSCIKVRRNTGEYHFH